MTMFKSFIIFLFSLCAILLKSLSGYCQDTMSGINFDSILTLDQILKKASNENKIVFIDCFTSWCGPCKWMDKNVYESSEVGKIANEKFISVKIQMDSGVLKQETVSNRVIDASEIKIKYDLTAYPTYIFLLPNGQLLLKSIGLRTIPEFIDMLDLVFNSKRSDELNRIGLREMAISKIAKGDTIEAKLLALQYFNSCKTNNNISVFDIEFLKYFKTIPEIEDAINRYRSKYMEKLPDSMCLKKEILDMVKVFSIPLRSTERAFKIILNNSEAVDSIMGGGFSERHVHKVIQNEEITPVILSFGEKNITKQNWMEIKNKISTKYTNLLAIILVQEAQLKYYKQKGDWSKFTKFRNIKDKKTSPTTDRDIFHHTSTWMLNVDAWDVFSNSNKKRNLKSSLKWINHAIKVETDSGKIIQYYDTKANLLYKLKKYHEATALENEAIKLDLRVAIRNGRRQGSFYNDFLNTLEKFSKKERTWGTNK